MRKYLNLRTILAIGLTFAFLLNSFGPVSWAQEDPFYLPKPGQMISLSPSFNPPILKGLKVHPDNPFKFDFILDQGDSPAFLKEGARGSSLKVESTKLIKYFLASLTIPEKDLWVNLSPYEKSRIVPDAFGRTAMGRDLLEEDYILKQITASLMYPEGERGKQFWKRIYTEAAKRFGTTNVPVNTFNKVWILPDKAVVYENAKAGTAYVVESKLKVMLEQDYLSMQKHADIRVAERGASPSPTDSRINRFGVGLGETRGQDPNISGFSSQIIREIIIPELTKEVNEGSNFAQLRQVYNSLILATWYKKKIKESILAAVYANKNKISGLLSSPNSSIMDPQYIYQQYIKSFKKGAYNYIKEESDPITQQHIQRKYFAGGVTLLETSVQMTTGDHVGALSNTAMLVTADMAMQNKPDELRKTAAETFEHKLYVQEGESIVLDEKHQLKCQLVDPSEGLYIFDYVTNDGRMFGYLWLIWNKEASFWEVKLQYIEGIVEKNKLLNRFPELGEKIFDFLKSHKKWYSPTSPLTGLVDVEDPEIKVELVRAFGDQAREIFEYFIDLAMEFRGKGLGHKAIVKLGAIFDEDIGSAHVLSRASVTMWERLGAKKESYLIRTKNGQIERAEYFVLRKGDLGGQDLRTRAEAAMLGLSQEDTQRIEPPYALMEGLPASSREDWMKATADMAMQNEPLKPVMDAYWGWMKTRYGEGNYRLEGKTDMLEENMESINGAVKTGRHRTLFYPAAGADILRALVAYDADEVLAIDKNDSANSDLEDMLNQAGIAFDTVDEIRDRIFYRTYTFEFAQRKRTVITLDEDLFQGKNAWQKYIREHWQNKVDVWHVFASPVSKPINLASAYPMINVGGFFSYNEARFFDDWMQAPSSYELIGFKEIKITRRYPYQVTTDHYPEKIISTFPEQGYIYQKQAEVTMQQLSLGLVLLGKVHGLIDAVNKRDRDALPAALNEVRKTIDYMATQGIDQDLLIRIRDEIITSLETRMEELGIEFEKQGALNNSAMQTVQPSNDLDPYAVDGFAMGYFKTKPAQKLRQKYANTHAFTVPDLDSSPKALGRLMKALVIYWYFHWGKSIDLHIHPKDMAKINSMIEQRIMGRYFRRNTADDFKVSFRDPKGEPLGSTGVAKAADFNPELGMTMDERNLKLKEAVISILRKDYPKAAVDKKINVAGREEGGFRIYIFDKDTRLLLRVDVGIGEHGISYINKLEHLKDELGLDSFAVLRLIFLATAGLYKEFRHFKIGSENGESKEFFRLFFEAYHIRIKQDAAGIETIDVLDQKFWEDLRSRIIHRLSNPAMLNTIEDSLLNPLVQRDLYDGLNEKNWHPNGFLLSFLSRYKFVLDEVARIIKGQTPLHGTVLSIGEGQGHLTSKLKEWGLKAFGIDVSKKNAKRALERGIVQAVGDSQYLPFPDNSFDTIVFNESIGAMKLDATFKEAFRVLKPGGRIVITQYPRWTDELMDFWSITAHYLVYSSKDIQGALERAGFEKAEKSDIFKRSDILFRFQFRFWVRMFAVIAKKPSANPPKMGEVSSLEGGRLLYNGHKIKRGTRTGGKILFSNTVVGTAAVKTWKWFVSARTLQKETRKIQSLMPYDGPMYYGQVTIDYRGRVLKGLAMEGIDGISLHDYLNRFFPPFSILPEHFQSLNFLKQSLYENGKALDDLHAGNLIITKEGKIRPIDMEVVHGVSSKGNPRRRDNTRQHFEFLEKRLTRKYQRQYNPNVSFVKRIALALRNNAAMNTMPQNGDFNIVNAKRILHDLKPEIYAIDESFDHLLHRRFSLGHQEFLADLTQVFVAWTDFESRVLIPGGHDEGKLKQEAEAMNVAVGYLNARLRVLGEANSFLDSVDEWKTLMHHFSILSEEIQNILAGKESLQIRKMEGINLKRIIEATVKNFVSYHEDAEIVIKSNAFFNLNVDPYAISKVIHNLVNNAYEAQEKSKKKRIRIQITKKKDTAYIVVSDNGPGLDVDQRQRIFQDDFTSKGPGHGIGLKTAKAFIEAHGGRLYVDDAVKWKSLKGATFVIELPITNPAQRAKGADGAMRSNSNINNNTGGIDLSATQASTLPNDGQAINFHINPAQLAELQNASGFTPIIINIRPLTNLRLFLGMTSF